MYEAIRIVQKKINELEEQHLIDEKDIELRDYAVRILKEIVEKFRFMNELKDFREQVVNDRKKQAKEK